MAATLTLARSDLFTTVAAVDFSIDDTVVVPLDFEPPRDEITAPVTITVSSAGITTTDWRVAVRVYVKVSGAAGIAQSILESIVLDIDHAVDSRYGESEWRIRLLEAENLLQAECIYERGREDR